MPAPLSQTTGRRKQAVARVRFRPGQGTITINKQPFDKYFTSATHRMLVTEPLRITNTAESYDAREKESKKYGLKKARKAPQYSKR